MRKNEAEWYSMTSNHIGKMYIIKRKENLSTLSLALPKNTIFVLLYTSCVKNLSKISIYAEPDKSIGTTDEIEKNKKYTLLAIITSKIPKSGKDPIMIPDEEITTLTKFRINKSSPKNTNHFNTINNFF